MDLARVPQNIKPKTESSQTGAEKPLSHFSEFTNQFVKTMEGVSKLAERGPSNLLLTLGSVLIIAALAMKIKLLGVEVSDLHPIEFIAIMLVALALLAGGSYLRFYLYVSSQKLGKEFSEKMLAVAQAAIGTAEKSVGVVRNQSDNQAVL